MRKLYYFHFGAFADSRVRKQRSKTAADTASVSQIRYAQIFYPLSLGVKNSGSEKIYPPGSGVAGDRPPARRLAAISEIKGINAF